MIDRETLLACTSEIVSAYVSNNAVGRDDIADVIDCVYGALVKTSNGDAHSAYRPDPAVPIAQSVTPDYIVCLEDGKQMKMLKRYLKSTYNMTPDEYRARWGLVPNYPMVAPNYAKKRSRLAKDSGLGKGKS